MKRFYSTKSVIIFKRWTRKRYAIFHSLGKIISIASIALCCSFLGKPTNGNAQNQGDTLRKTLEEVTITTEAPLETENIEPFLLQDIIAMQEIERSPVHAINELLEQLSGVDIRQRGPYNVQADISFRGGTFDQTIVLLNGINFSDPQTGHYTLNLPINPDILTKIELYKIGIVNLITGIDTIPNFQFHIMAGMYGLYQINSQFHWKSGKFRHLLANEYSHCNGYIANTDFNILSGFYQTIGDLKKGEIDIQLGYTQKKYGANSFYSLKYPSQYEETETLFTSIQWKNRGTVQFHPATYFRINKDQFQLKKWQNKAKDNRHFNYALGTTLETFFYTKAGKTIFLVDFRHEGIVSSSLGERLPQPIFISKNEAPYAYSTARSLMSFSASHNYTYNNFKIEIGYKLQYINRLHKQLFHLPSLFLAYQWKIPTKKQTIVSLQLFLSGNKTLRPPTFTDLYYHTGDILGNASLFPEEALMVEIGKRWNWKKMGENTAFLSIETSLFYRYGYHLIDFVKKENEELWRAMNHTVVQFMGSDISVQFTPKKRWSHFPCINVLTFHYNYLYSNKKSSNFQSKYLLDHLIHHLSFSLDGTIYQHLTFNFNCTYAQRKGTYTSYEKQTSGELKGYPPYFLVNLRLQYTFQPHLTFYVQGNNLLNQHYFDIGGLTQPGIWVSGGVKYKLRSK